MAAFSFLRNGSNIIGRDFYESSDIEEQRTAFIEDIIRYEVQPIDFEQLKASIRITEDEIQYYREYYGSLEAQLNNIRLQYE